MSIVITKAGMSEEGVINELDESINEQLRFPVFRVRKKRIGFW